MQKRHSSPRLRLVGIDLDAAPRSRAGMVDPAARKRARDVACENQSAAGNAALDPTDPRWILAVAAYSRLNGSTLTAEGRAGIVRTARVLGVRPFDANVIIAIAQDRARRGESIAAAAGTLRVIPCPNDLEGQGSSSGGNARRLHWAAVWIVALIAAAALVSVLVRWVTGG